MPMSVELTDSFLGYTCVYWYYLQNFEDATRVPFMLRVPGITDGGMRTDALVELIDIYPSLIELAGLPSQDLCPEDSHVSN